MIEKVKPAHLARKAILYVRQSVASAAGTSSAAYSAITTASPREPALIIFP